MSRILPVLVLVMALIMAACGSNQGSPGIAERSGGDTADGLAAGPAASSVAFVTAAIDGADAATYFAPAPFDDPARGNPFDPATLSGRLRELEAFGGTVTSVQPSPTAYPDAGPDRAPSCRQDSHLICEVQLEDASSQLLASVIVYWFDDGVTDFSIITRAPDGAPTGIGEARCEPGYQLVHGGHTPDRFDIAVCVDPSGAVQYNGRVRHEDLGIRLEACSRSETEWLADNEGTRYIVATAESPNRSTIEVFNRNNELIESGPFTTVRFEPVANPTPC